MVIHFNALDSHNVVHHEGNVSKLVCIVYHLIMNHVLRLSWLGHGELHVSVFIRNHVLDLGVSLVIKVFRKFD